MERIYVTSFANSLFSSLLLRNIDQHKHDKDTFSKFRRVKESNFIKHQEPGRGFV